jgi:hypothetical protein
VSSLTDADLQVSDPELDKSSPGSSDGGEPMLTLNRLDAIGAHRLHRKLGDAWRASEERIARRRYRLLCRVYMHLHTALLRSQAVA